MKLILSHSAAAPEGTNHSRRGMALVLVLAFLVLITGLVLAFFSSVSTELTSSKSYAGGVSTRQLTDTAANSVIASISQATTRGQGVAWTSQPGMIRTYGTTGNLASASPLAYYKLYSSDLLVVDSSSGLSTFDAKNDVEATWDLKRALYTDLNKPVLAPDPSNPSVTTPRFPVIDPRAKGSVDGFDYTASVNGVVTTGGDAQRLPMPVRWLYMLKDGTLTAPTGSSGSGPTSVATWAGSNKAPSSTNPITGRIAYWTDDETSKININTASGDAWTTPNTADAGSYWDTPRTKSVFDRDLLASNQPAKNEFQRYPGHPATTYLSTAFSGLGLTREDIAKLTPKVLGGGSKGGTAKPSAALGKDGDRLYASVDELLYAPDRTANAVLNKGVLERSRFFLTANSRAPEVNAFSQPRMSIWPITTDATGAQKATALDKLIMFCSTIGGKKYYLERQDPKSQTNDYQKFTRNQELYNYIKGFMSKDIPGVGGSFSGKYSSDYQQTLTEIFDYIRCTNLKDSSLGATAYASTGQVLPLRIGATQGFGRFSMINEIGIQFYAQSYDTTNLETKLQAVILPTIFSPALGMPQLANNFDIEITGLDTFRIGLSPTKVAPASPPVQSLGFPSTARVTVKNNCLSWHERPYGGQTGLGSVLLDNDGNAVRTLAAGSYPFYSKVLSNTGFNYAQVYPRFEFYGGTITIRIFPVGETAPAKAIQTMQVNFPDSPKVTGRDSVLGYYNAGGWSVPKPDATFPDYNMRLSKLNADAGASQIIRGADTVKSIQIGNAANGDPRMVAAQITGAAPTSTDYRYQENRDYLASGDNKKGKHDYSFQLADGVSYYVNNNDGVFGAMVDGQSYSTTTVRSTLPNRYDKGVKRADGKPGDFDTGLSNYPDHAYINRADEGDSNSAAGRIPYYLTAGSSPEAPVGETFFSPNRMAPSPGIFGSLPSGLISGKPWQTLLFCPNPAGDAHPGAVSPPDHQLLDLFWMPVVEPYAISEPFSTAGKVGLNHEIAPFNYITRTTALRAALKPLMIGALKPSDGTWAKDKSASSTNVWRRPLDLDETIKSIDLRSATKKFISASEICEVNLIPQGETTGSISAFWANHSLTGDNVREKPYVDLLPRLTTKSNTYTVHLRVQSLKQAIPASASASDPRWAQWREGKDLIQGDYRGSSVIERYIDPNDPRLSNGTIDPETQSIDAAYRYRIISTKKFAQ